jgi:hypothetical protein
MNYYMGTYHTPQNPRSTESSRPYKENGIKKSGKFGLRLPNPADKRAVFCFHHAVAAAEFRSSEKPM